MPGRSLIPVFCALAWLAPVGSAVADPSVPAQPQAAAPAQSSRRPADLAGTWDLSLIRSGARCRVMLRVERSDKGDDFLGMPAACRHAMPAIERVGRWALPDDDHLRLDDPAGKPVLVFAAAGDTYTAEGTGGTYRLSRAPTGRSTAGAVLTDASDSSDAVANFDSPVQAVPGRATIRPIAVSKTVEVVRDKPADLAGRYAVMREKRDTGCMLTLDDQSKGKHGGDRAQLAPGCRDQGIVIFDPVGWRLVKGELVLTARAGHTTKLDKLDEGSWAKDTKDGGKPLGLKKL